MKRAVRRSESRERCIAIFCELGQVGRRMGNGLLNLHRTHTQKIEGIMSRKGGQTAIHVYAQRMWSADRLCNALPESVVVMVIVLTPACSVTTAACRWQVDGMLLKRATRQVQKHVILAWTKWVIYQKTDLEKILSVPSSMSNSLPLLAATYLKIAVTELHYSSL